MNNIIDYNQLLKKQVRDKNVFWMPRPFSRGMKPYQPVPLNYPASAIGMLTITFTDERVQYGCASLIYRNVVITSAQNLFDRTNNQEATRISFISSSLEGGVYHGTKWHIPQQFKLGPNNENFNVAVIELNESVHNKLGFLGVNFTNPTHSSGCLFGYLHLSQRLSYREELPLHKVSTESFHNHIQFKAEEDNEFMSGSPILVWNQKKLDIEVVGLYTGKGRCLRLNEQQLNRLKEKLTSVPAQHLTLFNPNHPKDIVEKLVESEYHWQKRIFVLGIFFKVYGPGCPRILEKIQWTTLRNINLFDCNLTDEDLKDLAQGKFPALEKLYLGSNPYGNQGVQSLCKGSWTELSQLYLCNSLKNSGGSHATVACIYQVMRNLNQIRVLEMSEGSHGMPEILKSKVKVLFGREISFKS